MRNNLNPHLQVNLLDSLSQFDFNFRQISVLKPNFEQSESRLKRLCIRIDVVLRAERKLLNQTSQRIYNVTHILFSEQNNFLDSRISRFGNQILKSTSPFVKEIWQKVVAKISVQKIALLRCTLLPSTLNQHLVHIRVNKCA